MSSQVAPDIEEFVLRHLPTVGHLEVLLWMREHRERWWNADSIGSSLGLSSVTADKVLEQLCSGSLLAVSLGSALGYRFNPATPELDALVTAFIEACRTSRVRIYGLIASPTARSVRDFADAFRFRDDEKENRG